MIYIYLLGYLLTFMLMTYFEDESIIDMRISRIIEIAAWSLLSWYMVFCFTAALLLGWICDWLDDVKDKTLRDKIE